MNLAESLAAAGPRVVLVDMDLRSPDSHRLLGAHNEVGVSDVLLGRRTLDQCLQYVELPATEDSAPAAMYFLATGPQVANPTELLATPRAGSCSSGWPSRPTSCCSTRHRCCPSPTPS